MGTPCAVVFANLFMLWHHNEIIRIYYSNTSLVNQCHFLPKIYKRFIDDIFLMFTRFIDAQYFIKCFNLIHPSIQIENPQFSNPIFNYVYDYDFSVPTDSFPHVDILDITIFITCRRWHNIIDYKLVTKLFSKSCNTYLYLPVFSLHQPHIHKNWIKSEINRLRINCTYDIHFIRCLELFYNNLIRRGFTKSSIDPLFASTTDINRELLISTRIEKVNKKLALSIPPLMLYVTYSNNIHKIVNNDTLLPSTIIQQFEPDYNFMFKNKPRITFKNKPNLSRLLVVSRNFFNTITSVNDTTLLTTSLDSLAISDTTDNTLLLLDNT